MKKLVLDEMPPHELLSRWRLLWRHFPIYRMKLYFYPTTLQPLYKYHGIKVIADLTSEPDGSKNCTVYFTQGNTISMLAPISCLREGWSAHFSKEKPQFDKMYLHITTGLDGSFTEFEQKLKLTKYILENKNEIIDILKSV